MNCSNETMTALAEYINAFDKCAKEPDETYGAAFIAMEPKRERLKQFFTGQEFEAIIINLDEIRIVLHHAGVSFEQ